MLNQSKQLESFILINSREPLNKFMFHTPDLKSRIESFLFIGIDLPADELLKVIITKSFSDKQINIDPKITEYIVKNVAIIAPTTVATVVLELLVHGGGADTSRHTIQAQAQS